MKNLYTDNFNSFPKIKPAYEGYFLVLFDDYSMEVRQFINGKFVLEEDDLGVIIGWRVLQ